MHSVLIAPAPGHNVPDIFVADAGGAAAADAAAIAAGIPSRALMQRAGAAAATQLAARFATQLSQGVLVATGGGNNGGDGWVVARALHAVGARVRVVQCAEPGTDDARAERALAVTDGLETTRDVRELLTGGESIVVDALLGTGYRADSPLRGDIATAVAMISRLGERGASVVALDLPSGLDATTGRAQGEIVATLTLTFGTVRRGQLLARDRCGTIVLLDIGLGAFARQSGGAKLATPLWFRANLPDIPVAAHKGTRKKVAIIGGAKGMAGAPLLAARGALRSGAGLVKCVVAAESLAAVQRSEPAALAAEWPTNAKEWTERVTSWADVILIGPGLGVERARETVEQLLGTFAGPVVLDADALNAFAGDGDRLRQLFGGREALLTPHPLEFKRLVGDSGDSPAALAARTGATILLKGVPTSVVAPGGEEMIVAEGTPILATGGAGDVLGGIAATLLAQTGNAVLAGSLAAFAHGRAASALALTDVRGYTIDDVLELLPDIWALEPPLPTPPILAELPALRGNPT